MMDLPDNIKILKSSINHEDHILALNEILQGCSPRDLEKKLSKYVVENIEPSGWKAIWKSTGTLSQLPLALKQPLDLLVEIIDVSQHSLSASAILCCKSNYESILDETFSEELDIPLVELYPLSKQDYDTLDMAATSEVLEQLRFIYENICFPWDYHDELCFYSLGLIDERMALVQDVNTGVIPIQTSREMERIKFEALELQKKSNALEKKMKVDCDEYVDERDVVDLMVLNKEIENLEEKYDSLKSPTLKGLTNHQSLIQRKAFLGCINKDANVLVVCSGASVEVFESCLKGLGDFVKTIANSSMSHPSIQTFPSLQIALDAAKVGDIVVLLEGTYTFTNLGMISKGGTICCKGGQAEIVMDNSCGDILFDLDVEEGNHFLLQSIIVQTIEPRKIGITLHKGSLSIRDCTFKGPGMGLSLLKGTTCSVSQSSFLSSQSTAITCSNASSLQITNCSVADCNSALCLENDAKIEIKDSLKIENATLAISLSLSNISSEDCDLLIRKIIVDYEKIIFDNVGEKVSLQSK